MVPKLKGELRPPPPGAELRLAEPWELLDCSTTASTKEGSMAADVRRWGGYCRRTSSSAALTLGALGATVSTLACWPLAIMAIRTPVDTAYIWPAHASAWACQACVPARRCRTLAALLPDRIGHLYKCRPPPPSDIMQPGDRRLHWLPIAVDGTSRHEASYVHCTLGGIASPNQLSSWWLLGGSEKWETLYAASQEIDLDDELRKAATVGFKDTGGNDRQSLFFLCADGKAQVLMAGCQNWKAESPGATVCWVCMRNCAMCLATFGTASAIDGNWEPAVAINAIYRTITSDRRVPDYGLHGVLRVLLCGINGTRDLVVQLTGKAPATVARTMLQPVLDEARLAARTCTRASLNNDKANSKGKVRMECAAAIHFMRNRGCDKIIDACLQQPSVRQHQVGGKSWESVCKTW